MKKNIIIKGICILGMTVGTFSLSFGQQFQKDEVKTNIVQIENSTEKLKNLNPIVYNYDRNKFKSLDLPAGNHYGFLVRDVENVFPDMLETSSKMYKKGKNTTKIAKYEDVDNERLIPVLVAAIKEQQEQIEALIKEVEQLKAK
ncbi:tail fiber domain-containing protein [Sphingobacterium sp. SGR-19]|uniref:tail fiber domain-containing protein n=1 Tax=Sphingobacterium sp. SGR-19 TaxID=2710886 RepID=UPI0013EE0F9B|nr:tail fiber domain-containing protein [Sphingobacterium sp. SGR-19]NGM64048.1 tail fiber domain-containing protein [Sphingobacterium sp. SGR-19]